MIELSLSCNGLYMEKTREPILKTENEIIEELNRNILKGKKRHEDLSLSVCHKNGKTKKLNFTGF